ncbi:hypothetical protein CARUB_v10011029mg [Capsella rubella]|uniref:Uncharacterized protein n=1 Tax=Capsella rubella TaxID=81985 RepID=R0GSL6_9BRAS|nr:putative DNA-binding protein At1g48610 [Capsella rubella]EOA38781.1 hypothetical protein CARUB_v10011029mg [Capsella rubella]
MAKTASTPPGTGSEAPRSDTPGDASGNKLQPDVSAAVSAAPDNTASQKRGRGRPPKAKSGSTRNGAVSAKKPVGRPKRNVAPVPTASVAAGVKRRGRPKRSNPPASVVTTATGEGSRKRGRPKRDDVADATVPVAPAKKRGRKPNVEVAAAAKPVRKTRKKSISVAPVAAGIGDLKRRTALLQKKVKEAAAKLKAAVTAIDEVQEIVARM